MCKCADMQMCKLDSQLSTALPAEALAQVGQLSTVN
jgi:hypothetical protein